MIQICTLSKSIPHLDDMHPDRWDERKVDFSVRFGTHSTLITTISDFHARGFSAKEMHLFQFWALTILSILCSAGLMILKNWCV